MPLLRNGPKVLEEREGGLLWASRYMPRDPRWADTSKKIAERAVIGNELTLPTGETGFVAGVFVGEDVARVCLVQCP